MAEGGGKKWLAYGCVGCLSIVGLALVLGAFVFGTAYLRARSEEVVDPVFRHDVPSPVADVESVNSVGTTVEKPGRVTLDLFDGDFEIEPGKRGEPIRVEARYDEKSYKLEENYESGDDGWSYDVKFNRTSSGVLSILREALGGTRPEVRIFLPVDVPIAIDFKLGKGPSEIELGGLWLTEADIDVQMGGVQLQVGEPLREPMDRLEIRGSMGGASLSSLGNASPRKLDVDFSMGGVDMDLGGLWLQDSDVSIGVRMGGGSVRLPRDVNIVGVDSGRGLRPSEDGETKRPTLTFTVSSSQGEVEFY